LKESVFYFTSSKFKDFIIKTTKIELKCKFLHAYLLKDSLLVFSQKSEFVYGFERENAALFLQIDSLLTQNISKKDIFLQFSNVPLKFLEKIFNLTSCNENQDRESYSPKLEVGKFIEDKKVRISYVIQETTFLINYANNQLYDTIHPVIAQLESNLQTKNKISVDFNEVGNDNWHILFNNTEVAIPTQISRITLFLQDMMFIASYHFTDYIISMHAAALEYNNNVYIFPAVSGSGKTTLSAGLMNSDFSIYSDELAVIKSNGDILNLPFSLSIKEGSWKVLEESYPILSTTHYHIRFDEQKVKFLKPNVNVSPSKKPTHIIFPKYKKDAKTKLLSLSPCDAMNRIKEAGYELNKPLSEVTFEKILEYLLSLPTYSLEYSSLKEATKILKDLDNE